MVFEIGTAILEEHIWTYLKFYRDECNSMYVLKNNRKKNRKKAHLYIEE